MKTSEQGKSIIKLFEGLTLKSYLCPAKVWTIGWGHTKGVKQDQVINESKAEEFLEEDLKRFENHVISKVPNASQNEFDALVSFTYNVGSLYGNMLKSLQDGDKIKTVEMFNQYVKGGGKYLLGLHRRRLIEAIVFAGFNVDSSEFLKIRSKYTKTQINAKFGEIIQFLKEGKDAKNIV